MNESIDIFQEVIRIRQSGELAVLCLVTNVKGSAPQVVGAKMIVRADGTIIGTVGGGAFEHKVCQTAQEVLQEGKPRSISFKLGPDLGMCCGGAMEAYLEPLTIAQRLVIFGGGHVAKPMAALAHMIGFQVTVVDDRHEWANTERFPDVKELVHDDFVDYLERTTFGPHDFLLIVTRGHQHDQDILEKVVEGKHGWLGMIGSRKKVAGAFKRMEAKGISKEAIQRVETPVGLHLGAVSPEEIAISVAARLVQLRRLGPDAVKAHNLSYNSGETEPKPKSSTPKPE